MVKFFTLQIRMEKVTIVDVPEKYREAVRKELGI